MSNRSINNRFFSKQSFTKVKTIYKLTEKNKLWHFILIETIPMMVACGVLVSVISLKSPVLLFCLLMGSLIAIITQRIGQQLEIPKRKLIIVQIIAVVTLLSIFWLDYFAAPAQAQFFKKAEDFFQNTLTSGSNTNSNTQAAVGLVFNVLRALYLLYIAVALIGVVNAVRKDEDWQNIARTPLLVVVAVTIADVLTGFVIGSGNK
jgi:hypothetical protein